MWRRLADRITGANRRRAAYARALEQERAEQLAARQRIIATANRGRWDDTTQSEPQITPLTTYGQQRRYRR